MNKINLLYLLACFAAVSSCGKFKENFGRKNTTELKFQISQGVGINSWVGNAKEFMIYIVSTTGGYAGSVPIVLAANSTSATGSLIVPNGTYHGYALAWDASGLQANVGCWQDAATPHLLGGGAQTVNIAIAASNANCNYNSAGGPFGPAAYATSGNFLSLSINACNGTPSGGASCSPAPSSTSYISSASVKVVMENYEKNPNGQAIKGLGLQGTCVNFSSGSASGAGIIPVGSNVPGDDRFLSTTLLFYAGNGCAGTAAKVIRFPGGLLNGSPDATSAVSNGNSISVNVGP